MEGGVKNQLKYAESLKNGPLAYRAVFCEKKPLLFAGCKFYNAQLAAKRLLFPAMRRKSGVSGDLRRTFKIEGNKSNTRTPTGKST